MFVGFDTEFTFSRTRQFGERLHGDFSTLQPVCACLSFEDGSKLRLVDNWQRLQAFFDDPRYTFVVHGCHAEAVFCECVNLRFPERFRDTMLMALLIAHAGAFQPGGAYRQVSLSTQTTRFGIPFLWAGEKDAIRESITKGTAVAEYGLSRVMDYCTEDAQATLQLFRVLQTDFNSVCGRHAEQNLHQLYQPYALAMARAARRGMRFDTRGWDRLLEFAPSYRQRLIMTMREYG